MSGAETECGLIRALVRHLSRGEGLRCREERAGGGYRAVLESEEEAFVVVAPGDGGYLTLSLPLVTGEAFVRERLGDLVGVAAGYDVSLAPGAREGSEAGEVRLDLGLRLFLGGLNGEVFRLALENLRAARAALGQAFP